MKAKTPALDRFRVAAAVLVALPLLRMVLQLMLGLL